MAEYVQIKVKTIIKRLNDVKRQTNYLVCNIEGTGCEVFPLSISTSPGLFLARFSIFSLQNLEGEEKKVIFAT